MTIDFKFGGIWNYPVNTRLSDFLADKGQTIQQYFGITGSGTESDLAEALYNHFITSEIGLEELDIFDIKFKSEWKIRSPRAIALIDAQKEIVEQMFVESEKTTTYNETFNNTSEKTGEGSNDVTTDSTGTKAGTNKLTKSGTTEESGTNGGTSKTEYGKTVNVTNNSTVEKEEARFQEVGSLEQTDTATSQQTDGGEDTRTDSFTDSKNTTVSGTDTGETSENTTDKTTVTGSTTSSENTTGEQKHTGTVSESYKAVSPDYVIKLREALADVYTEFFGYFNKLFMEVL